jgi:hypothetical protein
VSTAGSLATHGDPFREHSVPKVLGDSVEIDELDFGRGFARQPFLDDEEPRFIDTTICDVDIAMLTAPPTRGSR